MTKETHTVNLTPPTATEGWLMSLDGAKSQGPSSYPVIPVREKNTADITFTIQNGVGQTITFAADPILVPPKSNTFSDPTGGGTSFTITDHNPKNEQIPYVLLFNGAPKLDPIIDNGGGGRITSTISDYAGYAVASLIALVIGMFAQKQFQLF